MATTRTPDADVAIDTALVRALLRAQVPDDADLDLELVANGWDNVTYRLGDTAAVRLPRRAAAAQLIRHEQRCLPELAEALPLEVPVPRYAGHPEAGYPWHWSVVPWIAGEPADRQPPDAGEAAQLGRFLRALHTAAPADAPRNPYRGVPLAGRAEGFEPRIRRLASSGVDTAVLEAAWAAAVEAPPWTAAPRWLHGDLHPRNVLVRGGTLCAVIDWGDVTAGDPATDLAAAWLLFDVPAHGVLREAYGDDDPALWRRAAGWAALFGAIFLEVGAEDERFLEVGRRTTARLAAGRAGVEGA